MDIRQSSRSADSADELVGGPFAVIESDPGVFTTLLHKLGVRGLEVTEIYDIEPWATDHLNPHGLIFCYMCSNTEETNTGEIEDEDAERVWFANQLSDDACASHALLNVLLNCPHVDLGEELRELQVATAEMSPVMRGLGVSGSRFIRDAHNSLASRKGPPAKKRKTTASPSKADNDDHLQEQYHFIGYVPAHGKVWELDGLQHTAIEVGELDSEPGSGPSTKGWMNVVRPALRMKMHVYMASESDHVRYNLLAIVDEKYLCASDELEMRKRERQALERRLQEAYPEGWADKVSDVLLASAAEAFTTSLRPSTEGLPFAADFGARKMDRDLEILDMAVRKLPEAWNACVEAALAAKVVVEEEIAKARETQTDHIKRTFDYEPFITQFIMCMHDEGLLEAAMSRGTIKDDDAQEPVVKTPAKRAGRRRRRRDV
ncbi:ubiquitin carboxyl-terminal hydrolase [Fomitopsis serialis]|uniref:ubiquitin carboxyl-terminal hydrolase n=1 Tax=Fomitopsis serialis TaxID=139415 RepID=UPI002007FAD3|nr:ubiquitin carboxyl-terminal hydrolase [Neoantrodia serialis]KAH9929151.1 ubiquitin carboxyl-terminal hydrolase [Neoantrodia serialis]